MRPVLPRLVSACLLGAAIASLARGDAWTVWRRAEAEARVSQMRAAEAARADAARQYRQLEEMRYQTQANAYEQERRRNEERERARREAEMAAAARRAREEVAAQERAREDERRRAAAERKRTYESDPKLGLAEAARAARAGAWDTARYYWRWWAERNNPEAQYRYGMWLAYVDQPAKRAEAFPWFAQSAATGHRQAMVEVGLATADGAGTGQDFAAALEWLQRAVQGDQLYAHVALGRVLDREDNPRRDHLRALMHRIHALTFTDEQLAAGKISRYELLPLRRGATLPQALALLGAAHETGTDGIPPDPGQAYEWSALAAQLSENSSFDAQRDRLAAKLPRRELGAAQARLAQGFSDGKFRQLPLVPSQVYAVKGWESAARNGDPGARLALAKAYATGWQGKPKDLPAAYAWYTVAAMLPGDPFRAEAERKRIHVGLILERRKDPAEKALRRGELLAAELIDSGLGAETPDYASAARHYDTAGGAAAWFRLAVMHEQGLGVARDPERARRYYRQAASAGSIEARLALTAVDGGEARSEDFVESLGWLLPVAEGDHAAAQYRVAELYEKHGDRPENLVAAYRWYLLAGSRGDGPAGVRERCVALEKRLTQEQQAQALAQIGLMRRAWSFTRLEAQFWLGLAAEMGSPTGLHHSGIANELDEASNVTPARALEYYRKAAAAGVAGSQLLIGQHYEEGAGVNADPVEACAWYWASGVYEGQLDGQLTPAQRRSARERLARMLEEGTEIPRDVVRAGAIWRLVAEADGHRGPAAEARNRIARALSLAGRGAVLREYGIILREGKYGAMRDEAGSWDWILKAADHGDADAMCELGRRAVPFTVKRMLGEEPLRMKVTAAAVAEATRWYVAAAKRGSGEAFFRLALLEERMIQRNGENAEDALGLVVDTEAPAKSAEAAAPPPPKPTMIDLVLPNLRELGLAAEVAPEEADSRPDHLQLLRAAARRGHGDALAALGEHRDGADWLGVLRAAARQGSAVAQCELARHYGGSAANNRLRAQLWLALAVESDLELTASYRELKSAITALQTNAGAAVEAFWRELSIVGREILD